MIAEPINGVEYRGRLMDEARIARIVTISFGSLWLVVLGLQMVSGF